MFGKGLNFRTLCLKGKMQESIERKDCRLLQTGRKGERKREIGKVRERERPLERARSQKK